MRVALIAMALTVVTGCGALLDNTAVVDGAWHTGEPQFESGTWLTLQANGTTVTGTGSFNYEAMAHGTVTVAGYIQSPDIYLTLTYSNGQVFAFRGTMPDPRHLSGTWALPNRPAETVVFRR